MGKMSSRYIARELYMRTRGKPFFSVNDLRKPPKHGKALQELFIHHNQTGAFFNYMQQEGLLRRAGMERAAHKAAKGRWVQRWTWTRKAHALFGVG